MSMEVAAGPTLGLSVFMHGGEKSKKPEDLVSGKRAGGFCFIAEEEEEKASTESSSIGAASSSSDGGDEDDRDGGEDEAQSRPNQSPLNALDSLEDSLPIKRGLSNFFTGKSKSFASLADVVTRAAGPGELAKPENPFNKRRRILMASKKSWSRRASYSSLLPPLPRIAVAEGDDEEEEGGGAGASTSLAAAAPAVVNRRLPRVTDERKEFRSPRSFSLSDLQRA